MIQLGKTVKDIVTGFEGVLVAKTEWLNGLNRAIVQPKIDKVGKLPGSEQFDLVQLVEVDTSGKETEAV